MQALNFQLDVYKSNVAMHKSFSTGVQGANSSYQDGTSFRQMLEKANGEKTKDGKSDIVEDSKKSQKANSNVKSETKTKNEEKPEVVEKSEIEIKVENNKTESKIFSKIEVNEDIDVFVLEYENAFAQDAVEEVNDVEIFSGVYEKTETEKTAKKTEKNLEFVADQMLIASLTEKTEPVNFCEVFTENTNSVEIKDEVKDVKKQFEILQEAIQVIDERTQMQENVSKDSFVKTVQTEKQSEGETDLNFVYSNAEKGLMNVDITLNGTETKASSEINFSQMISQEIQNNAVELVQKGTVVLKDGGQGIINLVLHPEKLGNVKINLELSEKVIEGKIVVQSKEAFIAMKESLPVLKAAFSESGFETQGFDLSWAGQDKGQNEKNPNWEKYDVNQIGFYDDDEFVGLQTQLSHVASFYDKSTVSVLV
ncbi:MAG: hypothetical protein GX220_03655 [Treponema sp.]|nr:hypothetical protein [Treponema sp.]